MNFQLTQEQQDIQQRAANFAAEYVAPYAAEWDRDETFPADAIKACAEHGLTGLTVPKEKGGHGASSISYALAIMELAKACSSTAVTVAVSSMVAETISHYGTQEQIDKYIPKILSGEYIAGSFALSEPGAGSDAGALNTKVQFEGDDVIINGEKCWISSGTHAGVFVVWTRTGEGEGTRGITTYLVEPEDEGFHIGRKEDKMGLRASTTVSLQFEDCRVPQSRKMGESGRGFRIAMTALDGGRIGVASQALGIAMRAIEETHTYLKRTQDTLNGEQRQWLAEMTSKASAAKLLILRAAWLKDQKRPFSEKAAMAKAYSTEIANEICQRAVALLGEAGCNEETAVERLFRDCKVTTIYEGTSEVQRIVISRSILRD
ncbi:MAG TPA: acyl-CoA dehydrogenase [Myxococcales bacterium]|nr:acyl-CoA dehydrogenase [Deltaproteobacteria bacterium]HAA53813.1 acyl-CoA dehydrogenase [Myxococcales bacterium]